MSSLFLHKSLHMYLPSLNRSTFQHGLKIKDTIELSPSVNASAHNKNSEIDRHDFARSTNGVNHSDEHSLGDTQSSLEPSSGPPPSSEETGDSLLPSSDQSVLDLTADDSSPKPEQAPPDSAPVVVQQPTSDMRDEPHPTDVERRTQPEDEDTHQDASKDSDLPNGVLPKSSDPGPELVGESNSQPASVLPHPSKDVTVDQSSPIRTANLPNHPPVPIPEGGAVETPIDPAPSPALPEDQPMPEPECEASTDQIMQDVPPSPAKVAREREDDDLEDGPAAKRSKTEDDTSAGFKVPERPAINTQMNGVQGSEPGKWSQPMTPLQHKSLLRNMQNVKRIQSSAPFRLPVDYVTLSIPSYPTIITKPMDLRTLEENLKADKYSTVNEFVADFNQIVENCRTFNGPEHTVTKFANDMKTSFEKQMEKVPGPDMVDPSPADKKKKTSLPPMAKVSAPRRESRSSLPGTARSPVSAVSTPTSAQTFALGPQGVPLIRRDSTLGDGRPKREIHPPAPRDLPYANSKPKKKKYQYELRFCEKVLSELQKPKYINLMAPFSQPVDPVALNIPTYHSIIKKPMDFGTMRNGLEQGAYENAKEFEADARQVFQNCYKFNKPHEWVHMTGKELEKIFDSEWQKKREWIEANTPSSGAQSPGSSDAEDSEEEEDEEEEEEDEAQAQLSKLQQQIAQMSKQVEMITQKKKSPPVSNKKATKGAKPIRKDSKKTAAPVKIEKKASKPAKKAPYVTYEQKQDISNRINSLSESKMATALKIIRDSMPSLKVGPEIRRIILFISTSAIFNHELDTDLYFSQGVEEDELELDIDELSDEVLHKYV